MPAHKWQFAPRFRRQAFGWRSDTPIQRIKEALAEIKAMARKDPVLAAEGAVFLLEKLSPALEQVDGSSGAIGSAVNRTVTMLVPFIAKVEVDPDIRGRWLERLWQAVQKDGSLVAPLSSHRLPATPLHCPPGLPAQGHSPRTGRPRWPARLCCRRYCRAVALIFGRHARAICERLPIACRQRAARCHRVSAGNCTRYAATPASSRWPVTPH